MIEYCTDFECIGKKEVSASQVFEVVPKVFLDTRGLFCEVLKDKDYDRKEPLWLSNCRWIRQINRSTSVSKAVRGFHAQSGVFCQAKLVEALTEPIYDIIVDARPNSNTFGKSRVFKLDPVAQNKLFVPRGFLHCVVIPKCSQPAVLQYFCDNVYSHSSEIGINPETALPIVLNAMSDEDKSKYSEFAEMAEDYSSLLFSDKDKAGLDFSAWMAEVKQKFDTDQSFWYMP